MNGIDLFNPNLLDSVRNQLKSAGLIFRPLNSQDYNKGNYFELKINNN